MLPGVEHRLEVGRGYIHLLIQKTNSNLLAFSWSSEVLLYESEENAFQVSSSESCFMLPTWPQFYLELELKACWFNPEIISDRQLGSICHCIWNPKLQRLRVSVITVWVAGTTNMVYFYHKLLVVIFTMHKPIQTTEYFTHFTNKDMNTLEWVLCFGIQFWVFYSEYLFSFNLNFFLTYINQWSKIKYIKE